MAFPTLRNARHGTNFALAFVIASVTACQGEVPSDDGSIGVGGSTSDTSSLPSSGGSTMSSGGAPMGGSGGTGSGGVPLTGGASSTGGATQNAGCTDTPRSGESCADAKTWGFCGQAWFAGYCQATCGICIASGSGGAPSTGGSPATGGSKATGGVPPTGGNAPTGGNVPTGGRATGGNAPTGGNVPTGGRATGGNAPTGGNVPTGGRATGGNAPTGGNVPTGGRATGGNVPTGGNLPTGGRATGGNPPTGGNVPTGGRATGGNAPTGGSKATGGNAPTGGSGGGTTVPRLTNGTDGTTTRYWDCCKPSCGWTANAAQNGKKPTNSCGSDGSTIVGVDTGSACSGGTAYQCYNFAPWSVSDTLSYGYAATGGGNGNCGKCYQIDFTGSGDNANASALATKTMIVQAINIGGDVASTQFDLLIPGGGVGAFNACSAQWGTSNLGAQYGGFLTACNYTNASCVNDYCNAVFGSKPTLLAGCLWFTGWFNAANNPKIKYAEVACPAAITAKSGM